MNRRFSIVVPAVIALLGFRTAFSEQTTNVAPSITPSRTVFTNETVESFAAKTNLTQITSKQLRMDTDKKIAYFDGDVVVIDPAFLLRANRLIVFLNPNGSGMERAEAFQDVVIRQDQEKRTAHSQKAIYTTVDGKIVLTGDPSLENANGITHGEVITIFRTNNLVTVVGDTHTEINLNASPEPAAKTNDTPKTESP